MGSLRITEFGGISPRHTRHVGTTARASIARDVKLWHGTLAPFRYPSLELEHDSKICSMFQKDCCWITSCNPCASFGVGDTDCNRIFATGIKKYPTYAKIPNCCDCERILDESELDWKRLGVPKPVNPPLFLSSDSLEAPDATDSAKGEQLKRESRSYVYTFINECGEEGPPSDPMQVFDVDIDGCATIAFVIPPLEEGFEVESIRIYRMGTGWNKEGAWGKASTDFFFAEEIPFQEGNITHQDCVTADCLGETNMSDCNYPPPECLENLISLPDGVLVGSAGKHLWFSEPWSYNGWDCALNLDDCIKAMVHCSGSIYVATDGHPYTISAASPVDDCKCCRTVFRHEESAPITSTRSATKLNNGMMYASDMGLVRVQANSLQIDTHKHIAEDDWQEWLPHQIQGVYYRGRYFGFNDTRGFIWDLNDSVYADGDIGVGSRLVELSLTPNALFASRNNILYMSFENGIFRWDNSDTYAPYVWRSKLHVEGGLKNFSAMKVVAHDWLMTRHHPDPVTMRLYADDRLAFERKICNSRPFRLPKGYDALNWEIEIDGVQEIMEVHMATSIRELALLNNV